MEKKKNIVIFVLSIVIVILSVVVILFATNAISFSDDIDGINDSDNIVNDNQNQNDNENQDVDNSQNNEDDNNQDVDNNIKDNVNEEQSSGCNNEDVFINKNVDKDILNELYGYLGMLPNKYNCSNSRLSYNISNNDYKKNADMIISLYSNSYDENDLILDNKEEIYLDGELCVFCGLIKKEDAERIYEFYNFSGKITDYFNVHSKYDDKYILELWNTSVELMWNGPDAGVKHNVTSEYINTSDIRIIDKQVVSYYNNSFYDLKSYEQEVTYDFVKDSEGNYYLSNVNVK